MILLIRGILKENKQRNEERHTKKQTLNDKEQTEGRWGRWEKRARD